MNNVYACLYNLVKCSEFPRKMFYYTTVTYQSYTVAKKVGGVADPPPKCFKHGFQKFVS